MSRTPNTVEIDRDLLRVIEQALKASADLPPLPTYQQLAVAVARAAGAEMRLSLWMKHMAREAEHGL